MPFTCRMAEWEWAMGLRAFSICVKAGTLSCAVAPRATTPRRRRGGVARLRWWRPVGDAAAVTHRRRAPTLYILLLRLPRAGQAAPTERRWEARCESRHRAQAGPPRAAAGGLRRRRRRVFGQASAAAQPSCRPQVAAGLARRSPLYAVRLQLCRRRLLRWRRPASLGLL